jgi:hypothetical protein
MGEIVNCGEEVTQQAFRMSRYRIKFLLETSLSSETDAEFAYKGHVLNLLFSQRINERRIRLATVVEDANWSSAINTAEKMISPVLDAISLHYKVDMMLHSAVEVVKAEDGNTRRAVLVDIQVADVPAFLNQQAINDIQEFLNANPPVKRSAVRWMRYYYRPLTTLDRFVFAWMAFENMAGSSKNVNACTVCGSPGCPHSILDTNNAFGLIHNADSTIDRGTFDGLFTSWRRDLRNPVFHGGRAVTTEMRRQMIEAMSKIVPAVEASIRTQAGFKNPYAGALPHGPRTRLIHHFIQFKVAQANEFADPPIEASRITSIIEKQQEPDGFDLLQAEEFKDW